MTVQSVILPNRICDRKELYIRTFGEIRLHTDYVEMKNDAVLCTDTYMNLFDAGTWLRYTGIRSWTLTLRISGKGKIRLIYRNKNEESLLLCVQQDSGTPKDIEIPFENHKADGMYFFEIEAETEVHLIKAFYASGGKIGQREIRFGLNICTYHRKEALYQNLQEIRASRFFDEADELYGKLQVYVIDNASELPLWQERFITVFHNPNTGGSGGFTRGIEEIRKDEARYNITNVIFMDDDVEILAETFYRLHALLSLIKEEYRQEVVAGRMFRTDDRKVQYTAAEIWNGGNIRHVGWNLDMTDRENLTDMNQNKGAQYGGWWFACFPMRFVRENVPLPFFLHCDDVEYGLRHGGTPIILNGIQVWHETYEYRQNPVIAYYDLRNALIVNSIYLLKQKPSSILHEWKRKISQPHLAGDYLTEHMMIRAMRDFMKGRDWFFQVNPEKLHLRLQKKRIFVLRIKNAVCWRIVYKKMQLCLEASVKSYQINI